LPKRGDTIRAGSGDGTSDRLPAAEPLLSAAGTLFRRQGYAATTVREIAKQAGVLPGSLHYRYPTKESLLVALMERGMNRAIAGVRLAIDSADEPLARMRAAAREHITQLLANDNAVFVLLYELRSLEGPARDRIVGLRDRYEALWDGLLLAAAGAGILRGDVDVTLLRLQLMGSLNWAAQWYSPHGQLAPEQLADLFLDNLVRGITH